MVKYINLFLQKALRNWNKFHTNLHKAITNPNPLINSIDSWICAGKYYKIILLLNITQLKIFQKALKTNSIIIPTNEHAGLPQDIRLAILKKKRLHRLWNPDFKIKTNQNNRTLKTTEPP